MTSSFKQDQKRIPAGSPGGGQWTNEGGPTKPHTPRTWTKHRRSARKWRPKTPESTSKEQGIKVAQQKRSAELAKLQAEREAQRLISFKGHKKTAMARFLAKQKVQREEAHAVGLPGPATIKKIRKFRDAGQEPGAQLRNKLRKLEHIAHRQGKPGFETLHAQAQIPKPRIGEVSPGGKNIFRRTPLGVDFGFQPWKEGETNPANKDLVWNHGLWVPKKDPVVLAQEKHERHVALRAEKEKEWFKHGKNIAAKRHIAKVKGIPFVTPAKPQEGAISTGGKFIWRDKRLARHGRPGFKAGWRLIQTENRAGFVPVPGQAPQRQNLPGRILPKRTPQPPVPGGLHGTKDPSWPDGVTKKEGYVGAHKDVNGKVLYVLPFDHQGNKGIFKSQAVDIEGDGRAVLKSNGYGEADRHGNLDDVSLGFAYREVAAHQIDQLLGLGVVPFTEEYIDSNNPLHNDHGSFHSLQHFIDGSIGRKFNDKRDAYDNLVDKSEVSKTALVDILFNNQDRHDGNWMISKDNHFYAIDNGLSMLSNDTDVVDIARGWGCDFKHYAQVGAPLADGHRGRFILSSDYKTKLQTVLANGSLRKITDWVTAGTKRGGRFNGNAEHVLKRAQNLVDNWDRIFTDGKVA